MGDYDAIFKAYDVRGTVPDQFDASMAERIGAAFGRFVADEDPSVTEVLVARDMRPSGVELVDAFATGARSQGLGVVDLGLASTDLLYFAAGSLDAPGAMFTASHNPARYNGIKFCRSGARPVGQDTGLGVIRDLAAAGVPARGEPGGLRSLDLLADFSRHVRSFIDPSPLPSLTVVADTANGMGGLVVPAVLGDGVLPGLGLDLEIMYGELDGTFPNHPADPIQPENQRDLMARVVEAGADLGLAFDGDADRVFLVDELGVGLSGSTTTAILAATLLDRAGGRGTVIHNLICSKAVPEIITEHGGTPVRSRVGHSFIKAEMADHDAIFGGEHSAHYYFAGNYRADSGLIAAIIVIEALARSGVALSEFRRPFERYAASGEINTVVDDPIAVIDRVAMAFPTAHQDRLDGLTVDFGDWWFNLRPSNTEPLLRLNLEAPDPTEVAARVEEVRGHFA